MVAVLFQHKRKKKEASQLPSVEISYQSNPISIAERTFLRRSTEYILSIV